MAMAMDVEMECMRYRRRLDNENEGGNTLFIGCICFLCRLGSLVYDLSGVRRSGEGRVYACVCNVCLICLSESSWVLAQLDLS